MMLVMAYAAPVLIPLVTSLVAAGATVYTAEQSRKAASKARDLISNTPPEPIKLDPDAASLARQRRVAQKRQTTRDDLVITPEGTPPVGDSGLAIPQQTF